MTRSVALFILLISFIVICQGLRCNVCSSPQIVKDKSYYDVQGYHYGLCEHSEDLGDEMECPNESTACGKLRISVNKAKVEGVLEEVKHLLPYSYTRRDLSITKFKQSILRERGRGRPSEEEVRDRLERNGMIEGYIRGCVHVFSNQRCIKDPLFNIAELCYCATDGCNGAEDLNKSNNLSLVISLFLFTLVNYLPYAPR